ncbi:FHA domain-containing protein [Halopseudomonas salegens]|uniref:Inner membrane component of T3SS domain-containing protein n=1 Tax=Halopseudomonas salegens TaxID=1434072 RepID=A0A1H2HG36_9GAMM|nr:FHA domain-containing protein [Halopseudomonas salegens]SDU30508.1 Inner membrane component of T3SS domain-containing protein [Halopseudomonas salegens]
MKSPIFIEVLARNGSVLRRQRFQQLPVRIGRAYTSDLILDDPHVAPQHAVLEDHEGQLVLRCDDTRNGIIVNKRAADQVDMQGHTHVRLGHTRLRVRSADHPVADELPDTTRHGWEGWMPALLGVIIAAVAAFGNEWLDGDSSTELFSLLSGTFLLLLLTVMWAALWALINRLFAGSARFGRHLFIISLGILFSTLWFKVSGVLAYWLSWAALDRHSDLFLLAPLALAIYFHLVTLSPRLSKRMAGITAGLYLIVTGMLLAINYETTGKLANKVYMDAPYPPGLRHNQTSTVAAFIERADAGEERLQALREKAEP